MITGIRQLPRPPAILVIPLAIALLVVGYGDGLAAGLQSRFNLPTPWIVTFSALLLSLAGYTMAARRVLAKTHVFQIVVVLWFFGVGLALQLLFHRSVYVAGYVQLAFFVVSLVLVRGLFARSPDRMLAALGPSLFLAHVFLCGYVLAAWLAWNMTGADVSVTRLLNPSVPVTINAYYGYRPVAWSVEPAWVAMALSVSFSAVYHLMPSARKIALGLMIAAGLVLQSGTLFLFIFVVLIVLLARRNALLAMFSVTLVLAALVVVAVPSGRVESVIEGRDPSMITRSMSAMVGADVVSRSFPIGVGYGNFRDYAVYGAEFSQFLDVSEASFYKSDVMILNLTAELGLGGLLLIAFVFRLLGFGRLLMPTIFLVMLPVATGTLLVPALLVLAAVRGHQDRLELRPHVRKMSRVDQRPRHLSAVRGEHAIHTRRSPGKGMIKDAKLRLTVGDTGTTSDAGSRS